MVLHRSRASEVFESPTAPDAAPDVAPDDDVAAMAGHLVSHGIKQGPADKYARGLVDEGYDTVAMFDKLSLFELYDMFGFKPGPLRAVAEHRGGGASKPQKTPASTRSAGGAGGIGSYCCSRRQKKKAKKTAARDAELAGFRRCSPPPRARHLVAASLAADLAVDNGCEIYSRSQEEWQKGVVTQFLGPLKIKVEYSGRSCDVDLNDPRLSEYFRAKAVAFSNATAPGAAALGMAGAEGAAPNSARQNGIASHGAELPDVRVALSAAERGQGAKGQHVADTAMPPINPEVAVVVAEPALPPNPGQLGRNRSVALEEHLRCAGIPAAACTGYATDLIEDGYETAEMFEGLSIDELRTDYGFKKGHLKAIERLRSAAKPSGKSPAQP